MGRITVNRIIDAPIEVVFKTVSEISEFSKALPHVTHYEYLTEQTVGFGTKFRETRLHNGKENHTELEVTEYTENERVRMVADSHGTVWDTLFTTKLSGNQVSLELVMDANAYQWMARIMNMLIKGLIKKAVERDMDMVKQYCESQN